MAMSDEARAEFEREMTKEIEHGIEVIEAEARGEDIHGDGGFDSTTFGDVPPPWYEKQKRGMSQEPCPNPNCVFINGHEGICSNQVPSGVTIVLPMPQSAQGMRCLVIGGEALNRFVQRNKDYGDEARVLGLKGQYSDLNRKMIKLKRIMWDEVEPVNETAEEILHDLLGNILLTLDMMKEGK